MKMKSYSFLYLTEYKRKDLFIKDDPVSKNKTCNDGIITEETHHQEYVKSENIEFLWNCLSSLHY